MARLSGLAMLVASGHHMMSIAADAVHSLVHGLVTGSDSKSNNRRRI